MVVGAAGGAAAGGVTAGGVGVGVVAIGGAALAVRARGTGQNAEVGTASNFDDDLSFVLDSGANVHVSPVRSDFKTFCEITPFHVDGAGDSSVKAVGKGTIELFLPSGHTLTLSEVLYIPSIKPRIISISKLNGSADNKCHFDSSWRITNRRNDIISSSTLCSHGPYTGLYALSVQSIIH